MKRVSLVLAALLAAAALTACSSGSSPSSGGSSGTASGHKTLGIVALVATDALNAAVIRGATEEAKAHGWSVTVTDTQGSPEKANAAMTSFSTTQKVSAILVCAFQSSAINAGLTAARQAGIPVVSWGGTLAPGIVGTTSALQVGRDSVNDMLAGFGHKGAVLALTYHTGVLCLYRGIAFSAAMAKQPGIKVTSSEVAIPGQVQDGTQFTSAWLASHPKGSGPLAVWGSWDEPAMGAIAALKQAGRTDVKVYSINGGPQALQAVENGSMAQVIWEDGALEGKDLFDAAAGAIKTGSSWKPEVINVPGVLVDKATIKQFLATHPGALSS